MTAINELGLEAAWSPAPRRVHDGPSYTGSTGLTVHRFSDGALAIAVNAHDQPQSRTAMHLSSGQAEQLGDALRVFDRATRPSSILDEAREIVHGDREQTHGAPDRNLVAIAGIWSALLRDHLQPGHTVTPQLVCLLMAGLKLARASHRPSHREHPLDVVGYMALLERCGWIDPK